MNESDNEVLDWSRTALSVMGCLPPGLAEALIARNAKLEAALRGLVDRLGEIHADPVYQSVWTVHQIHAGSYAGPTYVEALARARAALEDPQ